MTTFEHIAAAADEVAAEEEYTLIPTASGTAIWRTNGDCAEFESRSNAEEAVASLLAGEETEDDYDWTPAAEVPDSWKESYSSILDQIG